VLAVSLSLYPYNRATFELARHAALRGWRWSEITDSRVSPLARLAQESIIVTASSRSYFQTTSPAVATVEILAAILAARSGANAEETVRNTEALLADFDVYLSQTPARSIRNAVGSGEQQILTTSRTRRIDKVSA
jgi:DNA-binding MurR/RpiR family transcriptional regulator